MAILFLVILEIWQKSHCKREFLTLKKLNHPHIGKVFDFGFDPKLKQYYFVGEFIEGKDIRKACAELKPAAIEELFVQALQALHYLHTYGGAGLRHNDIKAANILIAREKGELSVKLIDFGLANFSLLDVHGGTASYMSPEQIKEHSLSHQTDIYSLGVTMYRMLTGKLPYDAANNYSMIYQIMNIEPPPPSTFRPEIPAVLDGIVLRAMNKDTAKRYRTWDEMARDLVSFISDNVPQQEGIRDTEKFDTVRALPFFKQFNDVELWEVLRISEWRKVTKGEQILREGEEGLNFFIIANGSVRVVKQGRLLSLLHKGDCFGEMAHLSENGTKRSTDVLAKTDVKLIEIDPSVLALATSNCRYRFDEAFLRIIVKRLSVANTRIARLLSDHDEGQ